MGWFWSPFPVRGAPFRSPNLFCSQQAYCRKTLYLFVSRLLDVDSPRFLFNSQTLRMKVRRKERWSSTKSPAAVSSCMSLQIATTSSWDREEGSQVWRAAESCPQADRMCQWKGSSTLSHAAAGQVGREKSSNGHLRCAALFFCQTSSQRRLFALLDIQAVLRLDITASLFEVYLQPTIGMQLSNSCRGWVCW